MPLHHAPVPHDVGAEAGTQVLSGRTVVPQGDPVEAPRTIRYVVVGVMVGNLYITRLDTPHVELRADRYRWSLEGADSFKLVVDGFTRSRRNRRRWNVLYVPGGVQVILESVTGMVVVDSSYEQQTRVRRARWALWMWFKPFHTPASIVDYRTH